MSESEGGFRTTGVLLAYRKDGTREDDRPSHLPVRMRGEGGLFSEEYVQVDGARVVTVCAGERLIGAEAR